MKYFVWGAVTLVALSVLASVLLVVDGCAARPDGQSAGTVTDTDHSPGWWETQYVHHGGGQMTPVMRYHPPTWSVRVECADWTGWAAVTEAEYGKVRAGDRVVVRLSRTGLTNTRMASGIELTKGSR